MESIDTLSLDRYRVHYFREHDIPSRLTVLRRSWSEPYRLETGGEAPYPGDRIKIINHFDDNSNNTNYMVVESLHINPHDGLVERVTGMHEETQYRMTESFTIPYFKVVTSQRGAFRYGERVSVAYDPEIENPIKHLYIRNIYFHPTNGYFYDLVQENGDDGLLYIEEKLLSSREEKLLHPRTNTLPNI